MAKRIWVRACGRAICCVAGLVGSAAVADQAWKPTAGGTYDWNVEENWDSAVPGADDVVTFANTATGIQIVGGAGGTVLTLDVNNPTANRREFAEGLALTASNAVFRAGVTRYYADMTLVGGLGTVSRFGTASSQGPIFDIYGNVDASGVHGFSVARNNNLNNNAFGLVRLYAGGTLRINTPVGSQMKTDGHAGLLLGHCEGSSRAATIRAGYQQFGGTSVLGRLMVGYEKGAAASVAVVGGTMDLPYISSTTRFRVGHCGYGLFKQLGGEVMMMTNYSPSVSASSSDVAFGLGSNKTIGEGRYGAAFYSCGGVFKAGGDVALQTTAYVPTPTGMAPVSLTVDGDGCLDLRRLYVGGNATDGRASVNLNGGMLQVDRIASVTRPGIGEISGNGGKLVFKPEAVERQFAGLEYLNVYERGLTFECLAEVSIGDGSSSGACLRTPAGYGVASISASTNQDYRYDPFVVIEGGSGSNATAVALLDYDTRKITNFVVTCRGEGYLPTDQLVLKVTSPTAGGLSEIAGATFTLTANDPGSLVKKGSQRLILGSQPFFDGVYDVREGAMVQPSGEVGSPLVREVRIGGTAGAGACFQCASADRQGEPAYDNLINPEAVLSLVGNGTLTVPGGVNDETPHVQSFAELKVSGSGNAIRGVDGEAGPVDLTFGKLTFEDGARVVLSSNRNFRVFAPVSMAGQYLRQVSFEAVAGMVGYVCDDGQIVPRAKGMLLLFR